VGAIAGALAGAVAGRLVGAIAGALAGAVAGSNEVKDGPGVASLRMPVPKPDVMFAKANIDVRNLISFENIYTHFEVFSACHCPSLASLLQEE